MTGLADSNRAVLNTIGDRNDGVPQTYFIDRQMRIRYYELGFGASSPATFINHIEELLAE